MRKGEGEKMRVECRSNMSKVFIELVIIDEEEEERQNEWHQE